MTTPSDGHRDRVPQWDGEDPAEIAEAFWSLIDLGRRDEEAFMRELEGLTRSDLEHLYWTIESAAALLDDPEHVSATHEGVSEDTFEDISNWVVLQGRKVFLEAAEDASAMPAEVDDLDPVLALPSDILEVYERRFGDLLPEQD